MISFMGLTLTVAGIIIITESPLGIFIVIGFTFETNTVLSIVLVERYISITCFMGHTFVIDRFKIITVSPLGFFIIIRLALSKYKVRH